MRREFSYFVKKKIINWSFDVMCRLEFKNTKIIRNIKEPSILDSFSS